MTTRRAYREPLGHPVAAAELRANAGTQFDPVVVEAAMVVLSREDVAAVALTPHHSDA